MKTIQVYCGTYHKYNCGSIDGAWIDLSDFSDMDSFLKRCSELHADESDPEFMFQDIDNDFNFRVTGEPGLDEIEKMIDFLQLNSWEKEQVEAWVELFGWRETVKETLDAAENHYAGQADNWAEYAEQLYSECYEIPEFLQNYIDWHAIGRDLSFENSMASNGIIFHD